MQIPVFFELQAAPHWREVALLSDVHLQPGEPKTAQAWEKALASCTADALFILGDLFEVWVGDDADNDFERHCLEVLHRCSTQRAVYLMHGNRDFLFGQHAAQRAGVQLLADPTVLVWGDTRTLLTHGDALCVDDLPYQTFRAEVRTDAWQTRFLSQPLSERRALAAAMRAQSESQKKIVDIDRPTAEAWLQAAQASLLIHGHTHQPCYEKWSDRGKGNATSQARLVLSDWHADAKTPRLEMVSLRRSTQHAGALDISRQPLPRA